MPEDSPGVADRSIKQDRTLGRLANLPTTVLGLGGVSLLNDLASEMIYPLLPVFIAGVLGASTTMLGAIEGAAESVNSLLKLASGRLSDRLRRRKRLVLAGYLLSSLARPLIAATATAWQVLLLRGLDRTGKGVRTAPRDALIADASPADRLALGFSVQRSMDHVGAVLGPLVAAALLAAATKDLRVIFALSAIPAAATVLLLWWGVKEPARAAGRAPAARSSAPTLSSAPLEADPRLRGVLVAMFLFTLGNSTDAFLLLRAGQLGISVAALPLLWAAFHVSKAVWAIPGGMWADRAGPKRTIFTGWLVYAATYLGFAVVTTPWQVVLLFLFYGLYFGLTEGPERSLITSLAPADARGRALGAYHLAIGIGALPASLGFGFVWQHWGAATAFTLGAALAALATALLAAVLHGDDGVAG
ncbi:MAG: MFS transporter [Acidobacteriota bacterium]